MKYTWVLFLFLILFSCTSKQQKAEETTAIDTTQTSEPEQNEEAKVNEAPVSETEATFKRSENQLENFRAITNFQPGKSTAEMSIRDFVRVLGPASQTVKDKDSTCPIGQLHFWNATAQNCRIFALGDDYTSKDNFQASCRLYGIQLANEKESSDYAGFLGIKLGDEEKMVKEKLDEFVQKNPSYKYEELKERSAVEHFLTERQKSVYVVTDGKRYYHFAIGKKRKVSYILLSSFNVQAAC